MVIFQSHLEIFHCQLVIFQCDSVVFHSVILTFHTPYFGPRENSVTDLGCLFVHLRNYLNNVRDIIKVHFCQLRLFVSFNDLILVEWEFFQLY
jgi:hypothetical protein